MKTNFIAKNWDKGLVILMAVFILLLFRNSPAQESTPQQLVNTSKYQALYVGDNKPGIHIVLIVNTETGMLEKSISYEDINEKQTIFNFITKKLSTITLKGEIFK